MKNVIMIMFAAGLLLLTGCNTVEGAGKDIQKAGKAIEGEAAEHK